MMSCADRYYDFLGIIIKISSNSIDTINSLLEHFSIKEICTSTGYDIKLSYYDISISEVDKYITIPEDAVLLGTNDLAFLIPVKFSVYLKGKQKWIDVEDNGRVFVDYDSGASSVVRYNSSYIDIIYWNAAFVISTLNSLLFCKDYFSVHASCVQVNGKGVLFTGYCGKGKSTSACAIMRKGYPILSDDRVLLHKEDLLYTGATITDVIKVRKPSLDKFFMEFSDYKAFYEIDDVSYYKVGNIKNYTHTPAVKIDYLVIINQTGKPESSIEKVSPMKVVDEIFPMTLNMQEPMNITAKFNFLMEFLNSVKCYCVHFGTDMDKFVQSIDELTRS